MININGIGKFVLLSFLLLICNCLFESKRDLTIIFKDAAPYFILRDNTFAYKGNNLDSLYAHLNLLYNNYGECILSGYPIGKCQKLLPHKCLMILPDTLKFKSIIDLRPALQYNEWSALFDLKIGNILLHIKAVLAYPGQHTTNPNNVIMNNINTPKPYVFLRIFANPDIFTVLIRNDTLYSGKYGQMNKFELTKTLDSLKKSNDFTFVYKTIDLYVTCDTPLKRLSEIASEFPNYEHIYFKLSPFMCTDTGNR